MNKRRERALEAFLYITFPIALFAGCSGLGNTKNDYALSTTDLGAAMIGEALPDDAYEGDWASPEYFLNPESDAGVVESAAEPASISYYCECVELQGAAI